LEIVKAHAFGNDFLLLHEASVPAQTDRAALARTVCDRHRGLGADGLIFFNSPGLNDFRKLGSGPDQGPMGPEPGSGPDRGGSGVEPGSGPLVTMALLNADGSYSEVSGNGVRCLAAWVADRTGAEPGARIDVRTDAGVKRLELLERIGGAFVFRAAMGQPDSVTMARLDVDGVPVDAVTLCVGNPQCVVLGAVTEARLHGLAAKLAVHPHFPHGTNVELATVESPGTVRILIWERGVGPTEASGTGACAAAVAAMTYGGADRDVEIVSPGGTQRVEWRDDGLYLTGSAEIIATCQWRA
jgi:diaminopimelate epimerase